MQQPENTNTDGKLALLTRVPPHPSLGTLARSRYADCGPDSDVSGRPKTSEPGPQSAYRERAKVPKFGCVGTLVNRASFPSVLVFSGCCTENRSHGHWRQPRQDSRAYPISRRDTKYRQSISISVRSLRFSQRPPSLC